MTVDVKTRKNTVVENTKLEKFTIEQSEIIKEDNIRDFFEDIISHVNVSSLFTKAKINPGKNSINLETTNEAKTVILNSFFHREQPWITDSFGISDLNRLKLLFSHPNFSKDGDKDVEITVNYKTKENQKIPSEILFFNKRTKTRAVHRFLSKEFVGDAKFKGIEWDISGEISDSKISEFFSFSQIESSREENFYLFSDNDDLFLSFGKEGSSTHSLSLPILQGCKGRLQASLLWKTSDFMNVLRTLKTGSEDRITFNITSKGILMLSKKTKIAEHKYILRSVGTA